MVMITTAAKQAPGFVMPTAEELKRLDKIVVNNLPRFAIQPDENPDERFKLFRNAFWAVGQLGRLPTLERENAKSSGWWADHCSQMLQRAGAYPFDIASGMFAFAVLAHADIAHSIGPRYPYDVSYGLTMGTSHRMASDQWRGLLESGKTLQPAHPPVIRESYFTIPIVKVTGGEASSENRVEFW